jgi:hypothetical protein
MYLTAMERIAAAMESRRKSRRSSLFEAGKNIATKIAAMLVPTKKPAKNFMLPPFPATIRTLGILSLIILWHHDFSATGCAVEIHR